MGGFPLLFLFTAIFVGYSSQHTYSLGECPDVTPMDNFDMNKMLGIWYVIKKTSTSSSCLTYNFTESHEPYNYKIEQDSHLNVPGNFNYHYEGRITVPNTTIPAKMKVKFALNYGSASYIVMMTDYVNYAAIFTCQNIAFGNRKSISILSRTNTLDDTYLDKIKYKLVTFNINPDALSAINQMDCKEADDGHNITITNNTFTAQNAAGIIRKAGDKLGDGVEYVAEKAKEVYNDHVGDGSKDVEKVSTRFTATNVNPDAEWIP